LLRLIPDDTNLPFMQWRRIAFPFSALLSILAIYLFFGVGLNFGIDFRGGTMIEVQSRAPAADISAMRTTLGGLGLGDVQLAGIRRSARCADPRRAAAGRRGGADRGGQ
jgi:preprotein translocase subunit SecF